MDKILFESLKKKSRQWRYDQPDDRVARLLKIKTWIKQNNSEIISALEKDFKKPPFETNLTEIFPTLTEINHTTKHLRQWMGDQRVKTPMTLLGYTSWVRYENKGVVLVISPWNYPFQLAMIPLITALAAGNTVVLKPSEMTEHTAELLKRFVVECFAADEVFVELGAKEKTEELLCYDFDHVFFTGSTPVGQIIAKACAERLIPMTLELGGKSPTIVDETADLTLASEKIFWGKFLNRGQTCVAPDYVMAHESIADILGEKLKYLAEKHQYDEQGDIITSKHAERFQKMSPENKVSTLQIVDQPPLNSVVMQQEIFGPVLPILKYKTEDELFDLVRKYDKPLALYIFSKSDQFIERVMTELPSGGVGINAVLVHLANHYLPFGGIGPSGQGRYHGHYGFLELSHQRAVIKQSYFAFLRQLTQPPYLPWKKKLIRLM